MYKITSFIARRIAILNEWLAELLIPKNTDYCYTRHYSKEKHIGSGLSEYTWTKPCPYFDFVWCKDPECYCNFPGDESIHKIEWCYYINHELSIQDACKDCLVSMSVPLDDEDAELSRIEFICNKCGTRYKQRAEADWCRECAKREREKG